MTCRQPCLTRPWLRSRRQGKADHGCGNRRVTVKPNQLGMAELARRIGAGQMTAEAAMHSCLQRIALRESEVGAFVSIDEAAALQAARAADRSVGLSGISGPLHGVPIGVKDIIDTRQFATAWGTSFYRNHQPGRNASCVELFLQAGAIIVGKTVTTEFAYFKPGKTANPHNPGHTPGGSSSGSAAAVADCMLPFAFGSQTAASLIRPAAYCGIPGYKASHGSFDLQGVMGLAPSMDTLGFLAREIEDFELARTVLCGSEPDVTDFDDTPLRVSLMRGAHWSEGSMEMRDVCQRALAALAEAGAQTGELACPEVFKVLTECQKTVMAYEVARARIFEYSHYREQISTAFVDLVESGLKITRRAYEDACSNRDRAMRVLQNLFVDTDVILAPSAPGEAPAGLDATGDPLYSRSWNLLQVPCLSIPFDTGPQGLPLSVQLIGPMNADDSLLAAAKWINRQFKRQLEAGA
jgi:Asp-tRNA(Asn)/Glu-tRNA(Gln) amidotransferase A subunit family amidase